MNPLKSAAIRAWNWWKYRPGGRAAREAAQRIGDAHDVRGLASAWDSPEGALVDLVRTGMWEVHYAPNPEQPEAIAAVRRYKVPGHLQVNDVIMIFSEQFAYGFRAPGVDPFNPRKVAYGCHGATSDVCAQMLALHFPTHPAGPQGAEPPTLYLRALLANFRTRVTKVPTNALKTADVARIVHRRKDTP